MEQTRKVPHKLLTAGLWIVLAGYAFVLVKIILLKYGLGAGLRSLNLIPFRFVYDLLFPSTSLGVGLKNVLGNFAIFIPLGVLAPALCKRIDRWWKAALLGLGVSALFELLQAAFGLGATDIDDLLLNTLGAAAGGVLYFGVFARFKAEWKTRLFAFAFLCAFGLCGLLSLWLFAPGELPRVVEHENVEVLGGLNPESYSVSRALSGIDAHSVRCRPPRLSEEQDAELPNEYPLASGAGVYLQTLTYQYSPNGNIQKTICSYAAIDLAAAQALLEADGTVFADLWLDENGVCTSMLLNVFSN